MTSLNHKTKSTTSNIHSEFPNALTADLYYEQRPFTLDHLTRASRRNPQPRLSKTGRSFTTPPPCQDAGIAS